MASGCEPWEDQLQRNLQQVRQRIAQAARQCSRSPHEICLVGVTKYGPPPLARALVQQGLFDLGESRPQELWRKAEVLADLPVRWHLIGPLQSNKVRRTLPLVHLIHSVDSLRLLAVLEEEAARLGRPVPVLLEVNLSGEAAKHGFWSEEMPAVVEQLARYPHVQVRGLMTMGPREGGLDAARRAFAGLRTLRERLRPLCPPSVTLDELSMGMSEDLEVAIAEGATIVRVGSALFTGLAPAE